MTKTEMMDMIIRTRGHEDPYTIWFCEVCEQNRQTKAMIKRCFEIAMNAKSEEMEEL